MSACYSYLPLASGTAPVAGDRVRVALTSDGTRELARYLGPNVASADGDVTARDADGSLVLAVDQVRTVNGIAQPWMGEGVVTFPAQYIASMSRRTYARRRSLVSATAVTAALVSTAIVALRAAGSKGGNDAGNQPPP